MVWLILASGASVVGGLIVVFNWYSIYASRRYGRLVSPIPIAGAVCLVAGLCGFDMTRSYAWIGVIVDYGTMSLVFVGIPVIVIQAWEVSRLNLLHSFAADVAGRRYEITQTDRFGDKRAAGFSPRGDRNASECRPSPKAPRGLKPAAL